MPPRGRGEGGGGGGDSHKKMTGVHVLPFRGQKYDRNYLLVLELLPLRGNNPFEPRLSNEILLPFRVFFEN